MHGKAIDRDEEDAILSMRMDAMLNSSPASFLSVLAASFAVYAYWSPATSTGLICWFTVITGVAVINVVSTLRYARRSPGGWPPEGWARFVRVMHLVSGLAWGLGGGWMLTFANDQQAVLTLAIGLSAVTVSIPSVVYLPAYNVFQLPIFWLYGLGLLFSQLDYGLLVSIGFFLMGAFAVVIGRGLGEQLSMALRLSIENRQLAQRLEERSEALESANRELQIQSLTDPLTGVANRRRLMSFARAQKGRCALLIVDIDDFKSYNDSFGHVEGDTCLVTVASTLTRNMRPKQDLVARLGGEEFAVILGDASMQDALETAETIRADIEALSTLPGSRLRRKVTVSVGLSTRPKNRGKPLVALMEEADAAVYRAKSTGRNRVCADDSSRVRHVA